MHRCHAQTLALFSRMVQAILFLQSFRLHRRLVQMPLNLQHAPMVMHTTYEFSELLLQAGVPDDLDAENVSTAGFVESIYALRLPLFF